MRLVQGDVGSGKTVVAALAALCCVEAGYQVAMMAPTELLAEQHRRNLSGWLEPLGLDVGWLSGRYKGRRRAAVLERLADGSLPLVVGTHALFQDDVSFADLGVAIIDDAAGDDTYAAASVSQGVGIFGVGVLVGGRGV